MGRMWFQPRRHRLVVVARHAVVGAVAARTRALEGAVEVDAARRWVAGVRAGRGQRGLERALIDIAAEEAVAPVARGAARARVAERRCRRGRRVGARRLRRAQRRARRALVHVRAAHAVARVARGARAREGAGEVGAVGGVEAVVRAGGALVDLHRQMGRVGLRVRGQSQGSGEGPESGFV